MSHPPVRSAVWACLAFTAAVFTSHYLLSPEIVLWTALFCALLGFLGRFLRGKPGICLRLAAFGAAAGCLCFLFQERLIREPAESHVGEQRPADFRVTDWPDVYDDSAYVTVRLTERGFPPVLCRLVSYVPGELDDLRPGDQLRGELRFSSALIRDGREVDNYAAQGIFLRAVCTDTPEYTGRWPFSFLYLPGRLGRAVLLTVQRLFPADTSGFVAALLTGEKGPLYADGDRYFALQEAGLAHAVAVSGMHISILMGFFFLLLGRSRSAVMAAIPVLALFAAMTGFSPSVSRAAFMQLCILAAPLFRREEDPITSLSVVLALLLFLNPSAASSVSLQLSFGAMAGIWLVSERMYRALTERIDASRLGGHRLIHWLGYLLAGSLSSSAGALLLSAPLAAAHFGTVSVVSPLSNLLCLWAVSAVYIGGGVTVALGALFPAAGALMAGALSWIVRYIFAVADVLRRIPCAMVYLSHPIFVLWLVFVYVLLLLTWLTARKGRGFRPAAPLCLAVIGLYAGAFAVKASWSDFLSLSALDVGQGECMVLCCGDRTVVVDCGGSPTMDAGETAVRFLGGRQRRHVDALILTHLHSDHCGGAARLLRQCRVDRLFLPAEADRDGHLPEILDAARRAGTEVEYVRSNLLLRVGELGCTIFAPQLPGGENENCLTVLATQGDFDVLITGDSPAAAEELLVSRYELPDIEILAVGHHGSRSATCPSLLETVRPDAAVISVGYNTYGHPAREVLSRLDAYHIRVYRTDEQGTVTLTAPGR